MVGKWRLNSLRRLVRLGVRAMGREDPPPGSTIGGLKVADALCVALEFLDVGVPKPDVLNPDVRDHDVLNQERIAVNSIGRRSDCQSRNTPPTRNTKSASQTPAAGERCPWRAKDTPI